MNLELKSPGDGYVVNPDGSTRKVRNLRPLLSRARDTRVTFVCVTPLEDHQASLEIHFITGHKFLERFASLKVCEEFASNPRRVWNRRGDLLK